MYGNEYQKYTYKWRSLLTLIFFCIPTCSNKSSKYYGILNIKTIKYYDIRIRGYLRT